MPDLVYQALLDLRREQKTLSTYSSKQKKNALIHERGKKLYFINLGVGSALIIWTILSLTISEFPNVLSVKYLLILGTFGLGLLLSAHWLKRA